MEVWEIAGNKRRLFRPSSGSATLCSAQMVGLFDVPGWSVSSEPLTSTSKTKGRKRKREDGISNTLSKAAKNVEVLMNQLGRPETKRSKRKRRSEDERLVLEDNSPSTIPKLVSTQKGVNKEVKMHSEVKPTTNSRIESSHRGKSMDDQKATPLQSKMKKSLEGAKFRWVF